MSNIRIMNGRVFINALWGWPLATRTIEIDRPLKRLMKQVGGNHLPVIRVLGFHCIREQVCVSMHSTPFYLSRPSVHEDGKRLGVFEYNHGYTAQLSGGRISVDFSTLVEVELSGDAFVFTLTNTVNPTPQLMNSLAKSREAHDRIDAILRNLFKGQIWFELEFS